MTSKNHIDEALSMVGYGRWQIPYFLLTFLIHGLIPVHIVGSSLLGVPLPFRCFSSPTGPLETKRYVSPNITTSQPPIVIYDSKCGVTEENVSRPLFLTHKTNMPSCPFVEYDLSAFPSTVISEFSLMCERTSLRPLFQMLVSVGVLIGAPLGGVISDKYGRKKIVIVASVANAGFVLVMALCPWYSVILMCRWFLGLTSACLVLPSYSLAQEITPPGFRSQTGMLAGLGFSVGIIVLAGIAFLVRPWRYLVLTASSLILVIFPLACSVEESPRWLAKEERQEEATDVLKRGARRNRVPISPKLVEILEELKMESNESDVQQTGTGRRQYFKQCWSYFRYPGMRRIMLIAPAIWYLQSLLYMGIILNANNFTNNDPFIYVAMSGVLDFIAIVLMTPIAMRVGRRCLSGLLFFFSGSLLLLDIAIPSEFQWLKWMFVLSAFLLASASYQIQFIYAPELFPTVIRSRGFGFVNGVGSLGLLTAPFITDILVQEVWWAVNAACGSAGMIASLLIPLLPETHNLPLPETLRDVERRFRSNKGKKSSYIVVKRTTTKGNTSGENSLIATIVKRSDEN